MLQLWPRKLNGSLSRTRDGLKKSCCMHRCCTCLQTGDEQTHTRSVLPAELRFWSSSASDCVWEVIHSLLDRNDRSSWIWTGETLSFGP